MSTILSEREAGLREAGEKYGKAAETALRGFLDNIGEEFLVWLANLYSPRDCKCNNFDEDGTKICLYKKDPNGNPLCRGGGFYYSNSARDTYGYYVDAESTAQVCNFVVRSGMINKYDRDFKKAFPKQMQKDILAFAKSLQDPEDGYFYHPQFGKNIIPSRRGRDLGWCVRLLDYMGDIPFYDTKIGTKGSLGAPLGDRKSEEGSEQKSTWVEQLRTLDAFKAYLDTFDVATKSYTTGNQMNGMSGQIAARDRQAIADGEAHDENGDGIAEDGYIAYFEKFFNEKQNPENGLWESGIYYYSTNALMKMSANYNNLGIRLNYPKTAFMSAIKIALLPADEQDEKGAYAYGSVDVYNPWVAMQQIMMNVQKFGTEEEYLELKQILAENAAALIEESRKKASKFKKPDGSFGYTWSCPPDISAGAKVCPRGEIEGDVNGGCIATIGVFRHICSALELNIPMFSDETFEKFISIIKKNCNYD